MPSSIATTKGRITLRQQLLNQAGIAPSQKVDLCKSPVARLALEAKLRDNDLNDFITCLHKPDLAVVRIKELNKTLVQGWADRSPENFGGLRRVGPR